MKGIGTSAGIAIGRVYIDWKEQLEIDKEYIEDVDMELDRLTLALDTAGQEIAEICAGIDCSMENRPGAMKRGDMLNDPEFIGQIKGRIITENVNAEWAVKTTADKFAQVFERLDNPDLKARADDVKDIAVRVCRLLLHVEGSDRFSRVKGEKVIIVCRSLTQEDLSLLQHEDVVGVVCEVETPYSHGVIWARNRHIPAVIGLPEITEMVDHGDLMIVDGERGDVILNPSEDQLQEYEGRRSRREAFQKQLEQYIGQPCRTLDDDLITLHGNASSPIDAAQVVALGGSGIGLYRTEYLYLSSDHAPTEGEQYGDYRRTVIAMKGGAVIFRTLDIGGDKIPEYLNMPSEVNPALGHRAIRFSLSRVDLFRSQLRAILRASAHGDAGIMLPLVTTLEELRDARVILEDVKEELRREELDFNPGIPMGIMVETPAAALTAELLAREADFLSIGTNDLVQYALAVDRSNETLARLYSPYAPAVLRLIRQVIDAGRSERKPVHLCGEMAGEPLLVPLLYGLGLRHFSVNPAMLLRTHWILSSLRKDDMEAAASEATKLGTALEVKDFCQRRFGSYARSE